MSIPIDSPWRGCAANFRQPLNHEDECEAQFLVETVYYYNCFAPNFPLADIVYRSNSREEDIIRHVFRWDTTPYDVVFRDGFQARRQQGTPDNIFYNLDHYVHHGGRPLESTRPSNYVFVSTTLNSNWHPSVNTREVREAWRYEIYAPGGIWVSETLGDRYRFPSQDEVAFVAGIAPQYVRSAQCFRLSHPAGSSYTRRERVDNVSVLNMNFNPQSHPERLLNIQRPVFEYIDQNGGRKLLRLKFHQPHQQMKCQVSKSNWNPKSWYGGGVANTNSYIDAAFRSSRTNEAYLFMKNEYVLLDYAPDSTDDKVLNGPLVICAGYLSLTGTAFGEHGIDCAFGSHKKDEAYIFSGNLCAQINYAPGTTDDWIIKGPMTITMMFPFFKGTAFEKGIDAAFESTVRNEAYLFKGNKYALINYRNPSLIAIRFITEGFRSLRGTIFETDIEAAFASHRTDEAYLFKGDHYALMNFAPGTSDDYLIGEVKPILPNWSSLRKILPRKNSGLDLHQHTNTAPDDANRDQDEW